MSEDASAQSTAVAAANRLEEQFRLTLSWRAKARREEDPSLPQAEACYAALRDAQHRRVGWLAGRLRNALDRQEALNQQLARGKVSPARANRLHRGLHQRMARCREEIELGNRLLKAVRPEDLGGFIDLAPAEYRKRMGRPTPRLWQRTAQRLDRQDRVALVITGVVLAGALLFGAYVTLWERELAVEVLPAGHGVFVVKCTNNSAQPIVFHAPWADARDEAGRWEYGTQVFIRENANQRFRLLPSEGPAWSHEGRPTYLAGPVSIPPGLTVAFRLELGNLELPSENYDALRITVSGASGRPVYVYTYRNPREETAEAA